MKKTFAVALVSLTLVLAAAGCGTQPGNETAYQERSNFCSDIFVNDYNRVNREVYLANSSTTVARAKKLVDEFAAKYKDVACQADMQSNDQLDSQRTKIDANAKVGEWRAHLGR